MTFKPIGRQLSSVLAEWIKNPEAQQPIVLAVWKRVVGEAVTKHSSPLSFSKGVLTIDVIDPAWGRVLKDMAPDLLVKLNSALGKRVVRSIEWRTGQEQT